jgi:hypothetical protein
VRRLLARTLVVLGGVCAATVIGWLLSAGSAHAATLPGVPQVPSALSTVADKVSTSDLASSVRPVLSTLPTKLPAKLPSTPSLDGVTKQVHAAVGGVHDRVTPAVTHAVSPATTLVHTTGLAPLVPATTAEHAASPVTSAAPPVRSATPVHVPAAPVRHWHATGTAPVQLPGAHRTVPAPAPVPAPRGHVPPLPPAGSSDSGAHNTGGVAGGASSASVPFQHVLGTGLRLAGRPSTPRPAVAPGQQPGTSPD